MLLTRDPVTKVTKHVHYDAVDETMVVETEQDITELAELNKASYNSYDRGSDKHGEWGDRYASIPPVLWAELVQKGIAYDEPRLRKWLDDSDNRVFRTRPGRLAKREAVR